MAISEEQLVTWSKQGPTPQFTATYETLRAVLNDSESPFYPHNFTVFLQGSYKNTTNVYGDSDVDVVIRLDDTFYTDLEQLPATDNAAWQAARADATYSLRQFKIDVIGWLTEKYGNDVKPGTKAIFIQGNGSRRNADVLVCAKLRRYHRFRGWADQSYTEGICFFRTDGERIDNFPDQHSDSCTTKHQNTRQWFKNTVRVYKNLRNTLIEKRLIEEGLAPSHFIECLIYNVPDAQFEGSNQQNFLNTLNWLYEATDKTQFVCANEMYYLLRPNSPVTWRAEKCATFMRAVIDYWNAP